MVVGELWRAGGRVDGLDFAIRLPFSEACSETCSETL